MEFIFKIRQSIDFSDCRVAERSEKSDQRLSGIPAGYLTLNKFIASFFDKN
jgi:hypothetical protein